MRYVFVAMLIALSGCVSDVRLQSAAAKQLVSAQAAATQEAMDYANATQTAAQAQQRLDESYARATQQANAAYQAQLNQINTQAQIQSATHEADVNAVMLSQAQEQATAQAVSLRATVQAIRIAQQTDFDGASATATAVERSVANAQTYDNANMVFTLVLKGGLVLVLLSFLYTGVEVLRKKYVIHMVDGVPFAIEGGAFGAMSARPLLLSAPAEDDQETRDHGITGNTGNTATNTGNTPNTVFPVTYRGKVERYLPRLTTEERTAIYKAKADAIRILTAAAEYNVVNVGSDPARIARYDAIGVKSEDRGAVCDMLEALNPAAVSIQQGGKNQGTFVTPEYGGNVSTLLEMIKAGDVRLYPAGFRSEAVDVAENLNREILSIPGTTR